MKIAGLDIGTTGCKCTVFDETGKNLGGAYRDYPVKRSVGGHEIDVSAIMEGVYGAVREMAAQYPDIGGLGVTSFGETFVLADAEGTPLHTAMLYTDPRGEAQCKALAEELGEEHMAEITGIAPHQMYSLPKILWLFANRPELREKTRHILLMEDYVIFHLTGEAVMDYSLATRTMAFDIRKLEFSREILDAAGVPAELFSRPVPTGTVAGALTEEAAAKTGLPRSTKVVAVAHDQVAAAVGAGAFDSSVAVDGAGTVECLTPVFDGIPDMEVMRRGGFAVVPHAIPGKYVCYAFSYTGGALLQWCTEQLAGAEKAAAKEKGISINSYLEALYKEERARDGLPEGPGELLVLPHFAGAATPYMDIGSKGAILGLTTASTPAQIYRGCMEGVAYEMLLNYLTAKPAGIKATRIHATGGGARSAVWMQMKADMLGLPMIALKTVDAGTVGSAMLTGVALGIYKDLEEAAEHMVEKVAVYEPRPEMTAKYREVYARYARVYEAVRPLM